MPNTKLQMLFRGQNMLGYRHYADDVVEYFVQKSVANGIDIIRIFDALNDIRNLRGVHHGQPSRQNAHVQACDLLHHQPGAQHRILCGVRQAAGKRPARTPSASRTWRACLTPYTAYELVKALKIRR